MWYASTNCLLQGKLPYFVPPPRDEQDDGEDEQDEELPMTETDKIEVGIVLYRDDKCLEDACGMCKCVITKAHVY